MATQFYCTACGNVGKPRVRNRGSSAIEIILWLCFIVPGLLYTLWRMSRKDRYCRVCKAANPIPANSPIAQRAMDANRVPEFAG
jgi:hypothetical protein